MGGGRGELSPGGDPDQHGPTKTTAALASHPPRAQLLGAVGGAGHRGVPAQQRHLHVHPNLLRPPRKSRACRRLPRQQRGPALGLWAHGMYICSCFLVSSQSMFTFYLSSSV